MENGIIPLRHGSLPGEVRLPKRFEKCIKENMSPASKRKSSIAHVQEENGEERLRDLMQAIMWVKQELILLRQHDILLKRQFCDIQHTIHTMYKSRRYRGKNLVTTSNSSLQSNESCDFGMDNYSVRSASSVTALDGTDTEEDDLGPFRHRTSSMKTTRDLAALARRRGSKELI